MGQWRRTQRYAAIQRIDEDALTEAIIEGNAAFSEFEIREAQMAKEAAEAEDEIAAHCAV